MVVFAAEAQANPSTAHIRRRRSYPLVPPSTPGRYTLKLLVVQMFWVGELLAEPDGGKSARNAQRLLAHPGGPRPARYVTTLRGVVDLFGCRVVFNLI